jgi:flagellar biosynthesis/type III secretory pathway protein FliH
MAFRPTGPGKSGFRSLAGGSSPFQVIEGGKVDAEEAPTPEAPSAVDAAELEALVAEAREQGRAEGRAEAEAEAEASVQQAQELLDTLGPLVDELTGLRRQAMEQAADDVAQLVLLFAQRVVDRSLALHPDALPTLVVDAVAQLPNRDELAIAVSPQLAERLARSLPAELRDHVQPDSDIVNGAVVRTRYVSIESTLAHASEGLEGAVKAWLSEQWWATGDGDFG